MNNPKPKIPVLIVDQNLKECMGRFNLIDYPLELRQLSERCAVALAMVAEAVDRSKQTEPSANDFITLLQKHPAFREDMSHYDHLPVAYYYQPALLNAVNSLLVAVKGFLDIYAVLIVKRLNPDGQIDGFRKSGKAAGGRLIKWIRNSVSAEVPNRDELIEAIEHHVKEWIQEAVELRDGVVHRGALGIKDEMHIAIDRNVKALSEADVSPPIMPDGSQPGLYADFLWNCLLHFVEDTLALLPPLGESTEGHL